MGSNSASEQPTPDVDSLEFGPTTVDFPLTINERLLKLEEDITKAGRDNLGDYSDTDDVNSDVSESDYVSPSGVGTASPTPAVTKTFTGRLQEYGQRALKWTNDNQAMTIYGVFGITFAIVFAALFFIKPKSIMKKYKGKKCIDWAAFMKWCVLITVVVGGAAVAAKMYLL